MTVLHANIDRRLLACWLVFTVLWVGTQLISPNNHYVASALVGLGCLLWNCWPILMEQGRTGMIDDITKNLKDIRGKKAELAFLGSLPLIFLVAYTVMEKPEPALVAVSLSFVLTHLPGQLLTLIRAPFLMMSNNHSNTAASSKTTLQRILLTISIVVAVMAIMCFFLDLHLELWSIALFNPMPLETSCMQRRHYLTEAIKSLNAVHHDALGIARRCLTFLVTYFGRMGEVPADYRSLLFVYIFAQCFVACPRTRRRLQVPLIAVIYTGFASASLKILVHRERPMWDANPRNFTGPSFSWRNTPEFSKIDMSTPSGHVAVTVAVARCLYRLWLHDSGLAEHVLPSTATTANPPPAAGSTALNNSANLNSARNWLRCVPFYMFGVIVGICRTARCSHWASDCVMGALVGVLVAGRIVPSVEAHPSAWGMLNGLVTKLRRH